MERPWFVGAVSTIVVALAAVTVIGSSGRLGEGSSGTLAATFGIDPMEAVAWTFAGLLGLTLLAALTGRGGAERTRRQRRPGGQAGVFLLLVVFAVVVLTIASVGIDDETDGPPPLPGEGSLVPLAAEQVVGTAGGLLAVAVIGAAAVGLWLLAARSKPDADDPVGPVERIIDDALLELGTGGDPREVIIRAYARLEKAFESGGMHRRPEEAPQEYVARVLEEVDVDRRSVARLTSLYEEARYSTHHIPDSLAVDARSVLGRIRRGLATA